MAESTQTLAAVAAVALVGTLFSVAMFETPAKTTAYVVQVDFVPPGDPALLTSVAAKPGRLSAQTVGRPRPKPRVDGGAATQNTAKPEVVRTAPGPKPDGKPYLGPGGPFGHLDPWTMDVKASGDTLRMHPRVNYCRKHEPAQLEPAAETTQGVHLGCFAKLDGEEFQTAGGGAVQTPRACLKQCADHGLRYAALEGGSKCLCGDVFGQHAADGVNSMAAFASRCSEGCNHTLDEAPSAGCDGVHVYRRGTWPAPFQFADQATQRAKATKAISETITVFIWANPRLAAIFRTCRLAQTSFRYDYDVYDLRHQIRNLHQDNTRALFKKFPGPKILVFDGATVPGWLVKEWPDQTLLIVTADETARWGFELAVGNKRKTFFPIFHNDEQEWDRKDVKELEGKAGRAGPDEIGHIVMPPKINPWFKQYYSARHVKFYGETVRYVPLGSREEFADPPDVFKPPSTRKYLYSFMGAPTDISRKKVRDIVKADTKIPKTWASASTTTFDASRAFLHMAEHWDANPNSDRNTYIKPEQYREVMLESVFTLCPKGHSIEQYRLYEAIESGSIPILAKEGHCPGGCPDYALERLPQAYFDSPMVVIQDWDEVVDTMLALESNQTALLERQMALREWYYRYMHGKIEEMEDALANKQR